MPIKKSAYFFFVYYFNNMLELTSEGMFPDWPNKQQEIDSLCEKYRDWSKKRIKRLFE